MTTSQSIVSKSAESARSRDRTDVPRRWHGCYDDGWKGFIQDESMAHPAKFARGLIRRIYEYCLEQGYLQSGDTVVDPFGGVGLGSLYALQNGINWIGCELEQKFVGMGGGCDCTGISKSDWIHFYGRWDRVNHAGGRHWCPQCLSQARQVVDAAPPQLSLFDDESSPSAAYVRNSGQIPHTVPHRYIGNIDLFGRYAKGDAMAVLIQGDSRNLAIVISESEAVISSPPFAGNSGGRGEASRQGIDAALFDRHGGGMIGGMGDAPENLGNLKHGDVDSVISSPPYVSGGHHPDQTGAWGGKSQPGSKDNAGYGQTQGQLGQLKEGDPAAIIGSPPFTGSVGSDDPDKRGGLYRDPKRRGDVNLSGNYGNTPGQLAVMPEGIISSPPFEESLAREHVTQSNRRAVADTKGISNTEHISPIDAGADNGKYGHARGQLGALKGGFDAAITSPPYESSVNQHDTANDTDRRIERMRQAGIDITNRANVGGSNGVARTAQAYGNHPGNIGADSGETFWSAAKLIVEQCHQILKPGGVAIWVCKDFIRDGQRVSFCDQWRQLCEHIGFEHIETFRAMLVKDKGVQIDLTGDNVELKTERKSFFRRLAEKNGSPRIDWEEVIVLRKAM